VLGRMLEDGYITRQNTTRRAPSRLRSASAAQAT
jgi:hypothetical protein